MSNEIITFGDIHDYVLLQLQPEILGEHLELKSSTEATSVLCTADRTFQLKDVQQSNTLLFVDKGNVITGQAKSWLETTRIEPILSGHLKTIPTYSPGSPSRGVERTTLYAQIPASRSEVEFFLHNNCCIENEGHIVKLDDEYVCHLVTTMINAILAGGLQLDNIAVESFDKAIEDEDEPSYMLHFVFKRFSTDSAIDIAAISQYFGLTLLQSVSVLALTEFMSQWRARMPRAIYQANLDLTLLNGHFTHNGDMIVPIDIISMPSDPRQRLEELLKIKSRWTKDELHIFLTSIVGAADKTKAVDTLLLRYTKKVKVGSITYHEKR